MLVKIRPKSLKFLLFQHEYMGIYKGEECIEGTFEDWMVD